MNTDTINNNEIDGRLKKLLECKNILLFGPHNSGKTLTSIKYSLYEISGNKSIYFTSTSKQDIIEKISLQSPEIKKIMNRDLFIFQAPTPNINGHNDELYSKIIMGILNPVIELKPNRIVIDEITPYLAFTNLNYLKKIINKLVNYLRDNNINFLITAAEPVSPRASAVIKILKEECSNYVNLSHNPIKVK